MPTKNYTIISEFLSQDPFKFLDEIKTDYVSIGGFKARNPTRSARMYEYISREIPVILGHKISDHMISTLCVIVDNETGFRRVRENGFPLTESAKAKVIEQSLYLGGRLRNAPLSASSAEYVRQRRKYIDGLSKDVPRRSLISTTMEDDCVKFRGTFWIQLTGRANFEAAGDTAFKIRRALASGEPNMLKVMGKHTKLSEMSSVEIDIMAMDPLMSLLVTLVFLSRTSKSPEMELVKRMAVLNDTTTTKALATIGYDNKPKKIEWGTVPSLNDMVRRVTNLKLLTLNNTNQNGKTKTESGPGARASRTFKFDRGNRGK